MSGNGYELAPADAAAVRRGIDDAASSVPSGAAPVHPDTFGELAAFFPPVLGVATGALDDWCAQTRAGLTALADKVDVASRVLQAADGDVAGWYGRTAG